MIRAKIISSGHKPFIDESFDSFPALLNISALGGEVLSLQLLIANEEGGYKETRPLGDITLSGELSGYATLRDVRSVAVERPIRPGHVDDNYLRTEPGIYPDLLTPLRYGGKVVATRDHLRSLWIDVKIPKGFSGRSELCATLVFPDAEPITASVCVSVIPADLPEQKLHFTQWFYCDCLANYYGVKAWSEEHWRIIEEFARLGAERGRDTIYTPLFTPALNTLVGYERTTTQLVDITVTNGNYSFDFSKVDRWADMCDRIGIRYFEISHLFDQHHAKHVPIVYGTVDGEYKRLFGWETPSLDGEFVRFLRQMMTEFVEHMKARGDDHRCLYHISDEPSLAVLDHYIAVKNTVADILQGYVIIDAISDYDFYKTGAINTPVPTTDDAMPFIEGGVPNLWVYYACNQTDDVSNSYLSMPLYRTRSIGFQMYKYDIKGFLHWGYNYYNNRGSGDGINPFVDLSGEDWVPAGDTFAVYPGADGKPLESIRMLALLEAMQDVRAMQLCESLYSREEVIRAIEEELTEPVTFKRCAKSADEMLRLRERINAMIAARI